MRISIAVALLVATGLLSLARADNGKKVPNQNELKQIKRRIKSMFHLVGECQPTALRLGEFLTRIISLMPF